MEQKEIPEGNKENNKTGLANLCSYLMEGAPGTKPQKRLFCVAMQAKIADFPPAPLTRGPGRVVSSGTCTRRRRYIFLMISSLLQIVPRHDNCVCRYCSSHILVFFKRTFPNLSASGEHLQRICQLCQTLPCHQG
jgi:hypothetical protein